MATRKDIHDKAQVYSWSAKVDFTLGQGCGFREFNHLLDPPPGEPWRPKALASLLWGQDYILTLESRAIHPLQRAAGLTGFRFTVHAEDTARSAEALGTKLAYALLSVAIDHRWPLALAWPDSPLPCRVIDRTAGLGIRGSRGFATVTRFMGIEHFIPMLEKGFSNYKEVPNRLLLSMELVAASRMETNNRSKLIMLASALEALAGQRDLTDQIGPLVARMLKEVAKTEIDESLKKSIAGQVGALTRESARRAVMRLVREGGLTEEDAEFVEDAYKARSKVLHEGQRVSELDTMVNRLDDILMKLYSSL